MKKILNQFGIKKDKMEKMCIKRNSAILKYYREIKLPSDKMENFKTSDINQLKAKIFANLYDDFEEKYKEAKNEYDELNK